MIVPAAASDSEEVIVPTTATEKPLCKEVRKRMAKLARWSRELAAESKARADHMNRKCEPMIYLI